jgi:hypothetical protein
MGFSRTDRTVMAASDPLAERLEELQDVLREGPALDAFRTAGPVIADSTEVRRRWPLLGQSFEARTPAVWCFPMRPYARVLGVVSVYRGDERPARLDTEESSFLVNSIAVAILGGIERSDGSELMWSARDVIDHATGMVVAQLAISPTDAVALLRAHAFAHESSLSEVSESVVTRRLSFVDDPTEERGGTP